MSRQFNIGVNGTAQKVRRCYLGVNGVAHKVKKGYIGDSNGIAQLFYRSTSELGYHGSGTALSLARQQLNSVSNKNYAIFAGGCAEGTGTTYANVDAYSRGLVRSVPTALSTKRYDIATATIQNISMFAGGSGSTAATAVVDTYDLSLTKGVAPDLRVARGCAEGATVGDHVLFLGGYEKKGDTRYSTVDAYDVSLTRIDTVSNLDVARSRHSVVVLGNYAITLGASDTTAADYFEVYDNSLTKIATTVTSNYTRELPKAATVGDYAIFGGGYRNRAVNDVDVIDKNLTKVSASNLRATAYYLAATTLEDYAIFAGGYGSSARATATAYTVSLTQIAPNDLGTARYNLTATAIGDYAIFAGGMNSSSDVSKVTNIYKLV